MKGGQFYHHGPVVDDSDVPRSLIGVDVALKRAGGKTMVNQYKTTIETRGSNVGLKVDQQKTVQTRDRYENNVYYAQYNNLGWLMLVPSWSS